MPPTAATARMLPAPWRQKGSATPRTTRARRYEAASQRSAISRLTRDPLQKGHCRGGGAHLGAGDEIDEAVALSRAASFRRRTDARQVVRLAARCPGFEARRPLIERGRGIAGRL